MVFSKLIPDIDFNNLLPFINLKPSKQPKKPKTHLKKPTQPTTLPHSGTKRERSDKRKENPIRRPAPQPPPLCGHPPQS